MQPLAATYSLQLPNRCFIEPQEVNELVQFRTHTNLLSIERNVVKISITERWE